MSRSLPIRQPFVGSGLTALERRVSEYGVCVLRAEPAAAWNRADILGAVVAQASIESERARRKGHGGAEAQTADEVLKLRRVRVALDGAMILGHEDRQRAGKQRRQ